MFENVIVGIGDHGSGRHALALATRLASAGGTITLLHVQVAGRPRSVEAEVSSVKAHSVASGLHAVARARHADLLVVTASRRDELGQMLIVDQTREVLQDAPCPVAVAPIGYAAEERRIERIAIAYDGSPESRRAAALARAVAANMHAHLSAVQVLPAPTFVRDPWNVQAEVAESIEDARSRIAELGDLDAHVRFGEAALELERFESSVDLLVLGAQRHGGLPRVVDATTSEALADHPSSPLLVLPPAATRVVPA